MSLRSGFRFPAGLFRILVPLGIVGMIGAAILLSQRAALAAPTQPLPFSHNLHAQAGVQCLYCHPNAMRSDVAGIPSLEKCMGCHSKIAVDRPAIQRLAGYWERQEPIPWEPVTLMADFVFFSHQPHLGAGLNCEDCHGDLASMAGARLVEEMDMGWCLVCHLRQPEEKVARLADCAACHK